MSRQFAPVLLGLTVFPCAAIGLAVYLAFRAGSDAMVVSGAILLLAVCMLFTAAVVLLKLSRFEDWLWALQDTLRDLAGRVDETSSRLARSEAREGKPALRLDEIAADMGLLRREVKDLLGASQRDPRAPDRDEAPSAAAPAGPEAAPAKPQPREQLSLLLEPVVELSTGITCHYRALLSLTDAAGNAVAHAELVEKAEQGGMRPALDVRMVKMVAPVLRRLRLKNPGLRVFVPVGRSTLESGEDAAKLLAILQKDVDVAGGIVFDFAQQDLGNLAPAGIENLARLARSGATLALREVYLAGLDLNALHQLGVRFLTFPPHAVDAGSGPTPAWSDFVKNARGMQMQVVVGEIKNGQQSAAAQKFARFGHGSFFAPPRRVRPGAGVAAAPAGEARSASVA